MKLLVFLAILLAGCSANSTGAVYPVYGPYNLSQEYETYCPNNVGDCSMTAYKICAQTNQKAVVDGLYVKHIEFHCAP